MGHRSRFVQELKASLSCSALLHDLPTSVRLQASRAVNLLLAPANRLIAMIFAAVVALGMVYDAPRLTVDRTATRIRVVPGDGVLGRVPVGILVVDDGCRGDQSDDARCNEISVFVGFLAGMAMAISVLVTAVLVTVVIVAAVIAVPVAMAAIVLMPITMVTFAVGTVIVVATLVVVGIGAWITLLDVMAPMVVPVAPIDMMTPLGVIAPVFLSLVLVVMALINLALVAVVSVSLGLVTRGGGRGERHGQGKGQNRGDGFVTQHLIVLLDCGRRLIFAWAGRWPVVRRCYACLPSAIPECGPTFS